MLDHLAEIFALLAVAVICGGTATFGAVKFDLPGFAILKKGILTSRDVYEILSQLETPHVLTVIYQESKGELRGDAKLTNVSQAAAKFYGYEKRTALVGKNAEELLNILLPLLKNGDEFAADQVQVQLDMKAGLKAVAKVPMKIKDDHPYEEYRGKIYHPVVAHTFTQTKRDDTAEDYSTVLYLDLSVLPVESLVV